MVPPPFSEAGVLFPFSDEEIEAQTEGKDLIDFTLPGMSGRGISQPRDASGDFELEKTIRGSL